MCFCSVRQYNNVDKIIPFCLHRNTSVGFFQQVKHVPKNCTKALPRESALGEKRLFFLLSAAEIHLFFVQNE